ncbi:MAG: 5-formyltetrahydrofolate cyclo-ligase [Gammaproteobacteria bacterium]|nr:5-formyltetrahydrofolate cyclo-ligase [Gammaproteobacteria bacterium]
MKTRQELRQQLRQQRRALSATRRAQLSHAICRHLAHDRRYQHARHVAFYLANDAEVDVSYLIQHAREHGKQVYLPVLGLRHSGKLWFVPYKPGDPLYWNRFGIAEPVHAPRDRHRPLRRMDLVLVPLVGFDQQGQRLGMGAGYYDKSLAHRRRDISHWRRPYSMGIAYALQELPHIEPHSLDVALDGVTTEYGIQYFSEA